MKISTCKETCKLNQNQVRLEPLLTVSKTNMTADQVLETLLDGNQRYVAKKLTHPHQNAARIHEIAMGQHPVAIILGCSDSRVPPEVIFDHGLGDLFVIRVAGNVVDDVVLGSIEYAVGEFGVPLVMVLGHERCGAVTAVVNHLKVPGHVSMLAAAIEPAIAHAKDFGTDPGNDPGNDPGKDSGNGPDKDSGNDLIDAAVIANIKLSVQQIKMSEPVLAESVKQGKVKIVGARYDLDEGLVRIVG